jgi:hypothetical protein
VLLHVEADIGDLVLLLVQIVVEEAVHDWAASILAMLLMQSGTQIHRSRLVCVLRTQCP